MPATPHRETAVKGEQGEKSCADQTACSFVSSVPSSERPNLQLLQTCEWHCVLVIIPKQVARPWLSTLMHLTYLAIHCSVPIITQYPKQFRTCVNISATLNIHSGVASRVIDGMTALAGLGGNHCASRKEDIGTCPCRCRCY